MMMSLVLFLVKEKQTKITSHMPCFSLQYRFLNFLPFKLFTQRRYPKAQKWQKSAKIYEAKLISWCPVSLWYWDWSFNISDCWNVHRFLNAVIQTMDILIDCNYLLWKYSELWQCKISCSQYNIWICKMENNWISVSILVNL